MLKQLANLVTRTDRHRQQAPSLDAMLLEMDKHLENFEVLVKPLPESRPRTPFDTDLPKETISMFNIDGKQRFRVMKKALPLFLNMQLSARMYDGKFRPAKNKAAPEFIAALEAMAIEAGAKNVAYVKVPRNAIFRDKGIPHQYAIIFTVEMEKEPIDSSPSFDSQEEVMRGYKNMAIISNKLARHLRKHGYAAYPGTALGGVTDYPHLAELAGLGAIGYHGLLISPDEGARLRINTIYTNISNLPIQSENEHLWIRDFCAKCRKCIRSCPVDAIYQEPVPRGDSGMQCIDHAACRDYFAQNYGCAVCLAICPFSQVGYDKVKRGFKGNPDAPQFRIPIADIMVAAAD